MSIEDTSQHTFSTFSIPSNSNCFSLFPLHPHCQMQAITTTFAAVRLNKNGVPCFNCDKKYFTAAFILPEDCIYLNRNSQFQRLEFEERRKNQQKGSDKLESPAPIDRHCQICRQQYIQYIPHVKSPQHLKHIQSSPANDLILDLAAKYCPKTKPIRKKDKNCPVIESQSVTRPCRTRQERANAFKLQQTFTKISCDTNLPSSLF